MGFKIDATLARLKAALARLGSRAEIAAENAQETRLATNFGDLPTRHIGREAELPSTVGMDKGRPKQFKTIAAQQPASAPVPAPALKPAMSIAEQRAVDHAGADFADGTMEMPMVTREMPLNALPQGGIHVAHTRAQKAEQRSLLERAMATREGDKQLTQSVSSPRR